MIKISMLIKVVSADDSSLRQVKHMSANNTRDVQGSNRGTASARCASQSLKNGGATVHLTQYNTPSPAATPFSGVFSPPPCRNMLPNGPTFGVFGTDNSLRSNVNSTIQAPRRKFVDEGNLKKISGRLFADSGPQRSTRLADAGTNDSISAKSTSGNGTCNVSKHLGISKLKYVSLGSVTGMKGQSWFNENSDEGIRNNVIDESWMNSALGACSWSKGDAKQCDQEEAGILIAGIVLSSARILAGIADILRFLRILVEGFRFSCLYRCQDALNVYTKLPPRHYNTRWVLSQVGKAYFELVDYFEQIEPLVLPIKHFLQFRWNGCLSRKWVEWSAPSSGIKSQSCPSNISSELHLLLN